jgi:hypothetical protein
MYAVWPMRATYTPKNDSIILPSIPTFLFPTHKVPPRLVDDEDSLSMRGIMSLYILHGHRHIAPCARYQAFCRGPGNHSFKILSPRSPLMTTSGSFSAMTPQVFGRRPPHLHCFAGVPTPGALPRASSICARMFASFGLRRNLTSTSLPPAPAPAAPPCIKPFSLRAPTTWLTCSHTTEITDFSRTSVTVCRAHNRVKQSARGVKSGKVHGGNFLERDGDIGERGRGRGRGSERERPCREWSTRS